MRYFVHREREVLQGHHDQLRSRAIGVTWDGLYPSKAGGFKNDLKIEN